MKDDYFANNPHHNENPAPCAEICFHPGIFPIIIIKIRQFSSPITKFPGRVILMPIEVVGAALALHAHFVMHEQTGGLNHEEDDQGRACRRDVPDRLFTRGRVVTIDFTTHAPGTSITTQIPGVTFSLQGGADNGAPQIAWYTGPFYGGGGLSNSANFGYYPTAYRLVATFTSTVKNVKFNFDNEGYNGGNYFSALDGLGNVLVTGALDTFAPVTGQAFDLTGITGIKTIFWDNGQSSTGGDWTQSLVSISFDASGVPEPAAWATMVLGMGAIGGMMRRRAKTAVRFA